MFSIKQHQRTLVWPEAQDRHE